MTVYSWQRVRRPGRPADGAWWAGDVRFCITPDFGNDPLPISVVRAGFRVELADGQALTPEEDARSADEVYSQPGAEVVGRQCLRGDVVFDVPTGPPATYFANAVSSFGWIRWQLS
jgi:hypothetical protein